MECVVAASSDGASFSDFGCFFFLTNHQIALFSTLSKLRSFSRNSQKPQRYTGLHLPITITPKHFHFGLSCANDIACKLMEIVFHFYQQNASSIEPPTHQSPAVSYTAGQKGKHALHVLYFLTEKRMKKQG